MGGGEAAAEVATPKPAPKVLAFNPNWAQLQQKLKAHRPSKPSRSTDVGSETLVGSVLGKRKEREGPVPDASPPVALSPTSADFSLTDVLAMDCEMVGVSSEGNKSAIGRVTLVNSCGNVVYDEYVRPMERIVDFRTRISGIRPKNMKKAKDFCEVQDKVAELIKGKLLVGHALRNDLKVLLLSHPKKNIRDTSEYEPLRRGNRTRALKHLAAEILGVNIQENFEDRFSIAYSLDREFGPRLKEHMQYCINHPEEMSKISKLKAQVTEVKDIMMDNIEKVLDRGEKIELLVDKTQSLQFQADDFQRHGRQLRRRMWLQSLRFKLMVAVIALAVILALWFMACKGFKC